MNLIKCSNDNCNQTFKLGRSKNKKFCCRFCWHHWQYHLDYLSRQAIKANYKNISIQKGQEFSEKIKKICLQSS